MTPFVGRMMGLSRLTPEKVAQKIFCVIRRQNPPLRVPATLDAVIFYYLRRLLPRRLLHPFLFYCLPNSRHWGKGYSNARHLKK